MKNLYRISPSVSVPDTDIEAICFYDTRQIRNVFKEAEKEGRAYRGGTRQIKALIITKHGDIFTAPYLPKTYADKLVLLRKISKDRSGCFLMEDCIRQVIFKLNSSYREMLKEKKSCGKFINCSRGKKTSCYVLTQSGYLFACSKLTEYIQEGGLS